MALEIDRHELTNRVRHFRPAAAGSRCARGAGSAPSAQQGVARLRAVWTGGARGVRVARQGCRGARASGRPVGKSWRALSHRYMHPDGRVTPKFINLDMEACAELHLTIAACKEVLAVADFWLWRKFATKPKCILFDHPRFRLAVSYDIVVHGHQGTVAVASVPGKFTACGIPRPTRDNP
jgi:hypothetical protein